MAVILLHPDDEPEELELLDNELEELLDPDELDELDELGGGVPIVTIAPATGNPVVQPVTQIVVWQRQDGGLIPHPQSYTTVCKYVSVSLPS